ncbi:MAG: glycosyltransferase [Prevotella sp.]|nr:glycosyltransferase [Prevotella sp.]
MKIAHVVWGMKTGGVETMLVNIINEQVKTEEVRLFIINDFIDEHILSKLSAKCKVVRINRKPGNRNPVKVLKLNISLIRYSPDIVHIHSYQVSKLLLWRWVVVRTIHNTDNVPYEYPKMSALYAISEIVKDVTVKQGFPQVKTINNGILVKSFCCRERTYNKPFYEIVQVSRLAIEQKGQDILLNAISILVSEFRIRSFRLHFIGCGGDEKLLKDMVQELNIEEFVCFEGLKDQSFICKHLCDYDLFVQPSRFEGFGLTVAEALAAKVPVLVSNVEGPMEIIGNGEYGMSFTMGDANDLAEKLKLILQGGYDYSMIEKAYQHVCKEYDVSVTAKKYIQEYYRICQ